MEREEDRVRRISVPGPAIDHPEDQALGKLSPGSSRLDAKTYRNLIELSISRARLVNSFTKSSNGFDETVSLRKWFLIADNYVIEKNPPLL